MPAWSWDAPEWVYRFRRMRRLERMDEPGLPSLERQAALDGLERIGAWPGQRQPLLHAVLDLLGPPSGRRRKVVEVGAGSGSLARWLARELGERGHRCEVLATDQVAVPGVRRLDAVQGRLPEADVYFSYFLLHHLDDAQVGTLLSRQAQASRRGLVHFDVQRHWFHFYGAAALLRLAGLPAINRYDCALSIQQGYTRAELIDLARPLAGATVDWTFPFRWRLQWRRP